MKEKKKKKYWERKRKKKIRRATDPIDQIPCNMLMFFVIILNTRGFERLWNNSIRARTEHNISSTAGEENVEEGEKYCKTTSELMSAIKTIKKSHKNNIFHILSSSSFPCQHLYSLCILIIILYCELFSEVEWNAWNAYMHHTS